MNTYQEITAPDYASPAVAAYGKIENIYLTDDIVGEVTIKPGGKLFDFVDDLTGQPYELSQAERDAWSSLWDAWLGKPSRGWTAPNLTTGLSTRRMSFCHAVARSIAAIRLTSMMPEIFPMPRRWLMSGVITSCRTCNPESE